MLCFWYLIFLFADVNTMQNLFKKLIFLLSIPASIISLQDIFYKFPNKVTTYACNIFIILGFLVFIISMIRNINSFLKKKFSQRWLSYVIIFLIISYTTCYLSGIKNESHKNIYTELTKNLDTLYTAVDNTSLSVNNIVYDEITSIKKELDTLVFNENPYKILSKMGYGISTHFFNMAILQGDIKAISLFIKIGKKWDSIEYKEKILPWLYVINDNIQNQKKVLLLLMSSGLNLSSKYQIETVSLRSGNFDVMYLGNKYGDIFIHRMANVEESTEHLLCFNGEFTPWQIALLTDQVETLKNMIYLGVNKYEVLEYTTKLLNSISDKTTIIQESAMMQSSSILWEYFLLPDWRNIKINKLKKVISSLGDM